MLKKIYLLLFFGLMFTESQAQKTAEEYFEEGKKYFNSQNFEQALLAFEQATQLRSNFASALLYRGTSAFYTGNPIGAAISWQKAKEAGIAQAQELIQKYINLEMYQSNKTAEAYHDEGQERFKKGDFYGAIIDYSNALYLNPELGWTYNKRAYAKIQIAITLTDANEKNALIKNAIADYDRAIQFRPADARLYTFRGIAKCLAGDKASGCQDINTGIERGHQQSQENNIPQRYCK